MFLLAISEAIFGFSLSIYCWKALPEHNMNIYKFVHIALFSLNPKSMKNMHFVRSDLCSPKYNR